MRTLRYLALGFVLIACTGCVETIAWYGGLEVANLALSLLPTQPIPGGRTMCALPKSQDVRVCTEALLAEGSQAVAFRDGEWRPVITDLEAMP
jgi:hypothetical protein